MGGHFSIREKVREGVSVTGKIYDVAVVGGGILGTSTAMALLKKRDLSLILLEEEECLAFHQSGRNSGVIHSGLYYRPESLKARFCVEGRDALIRFLREEGIPYEQCGKIVVATNEREETLLKALFERGRRNGLKGLEILVPDEVKKYEPHVQGRSALHVPETGIVDYSRVTRSYGRIVKARKGEILFGAQVMAIQKKKDSVSFSTTKGEIRSRVIVNCSGLFSDRVARMCGATVPMRIIPFRGEYYRLTGDSKKLVTNLIYPVPDPELPFLGVHFTRTIEGEIEAGPNAVLALSRKGYSRSDFSLRDVLEIVGYKGFWKLGARYFSVGMGEMARSFRKGSFVKALKSLIPEVAEGDLQPAASGVRAQAVSEEGTLVDDFVIVEKENGVHVLNAPSPAATSSIPIGRHIAELACKKLE